MNAADLAALVRVLRCAGIPYEPELDRLPFPVRHHAALTVALGHACIMEERLVSGPGKQGLRLLKSRIIAAMRWIEMLGSRSTNAGQRSWFERPRSP